MNPSSDPEWFTIRTTPAITFKPPAPPGDQVDEHSSWSTASGMLEWNSRVCPLPMVSRDPTMREVTRLYSFYEKRVLPMTGGLYDQPQLYLRAMELFEQRLALAAPRNG